MRNLEVLKHFLNLRKEQRLDRDGMEELQERRLGEMLAAASDTDFYGSSVQGLSPEEFLADPTALRMTMKEDVRDAGRFIRHGVRRESLGMMETSGSTGNSAQFYFDRDALNQRAALLALLQMEFGRSPFDLYAEISYSTPKPFPLSALGIFRKVHISVFQEESKTFAMLKRLRPDIIGWYPSVLGIMARLNGLEDRPLRLKSAYSGGEPLTGEGRRLIEDSFSCAVFEQYAATEFGCIAWECPEEHRLHVNSNTCLVEIVDDKGKPSRSGNIIITGLINKAMPLLRYSIGDMGTWGKECSCGRATPVLDSVSGRSDDLFILPSGKMRSPRAMDPCQGLTSISSFQMIQEEPGHLLFRYVPSSEGLTESIRETVASRMRSACLGEDVQIEFEEVDRIQRGRTGKIDTFISKVKP